MSTLYLECASKHFHIYFNYLIHEGVVCVSSATCAGYTRALIKAKINPNIYLLREILILFSIYRYLIYYNFGNLHI